MPQELFTENEVLQVIRERCRPPSSQAAQAEEVGMSLSQLNRLLKGHYSLTPETAAKFGFVAQEHTFKRAEEITHE